MIDGPLKEFAPMSIDWLCKHHTDLSKDQLYAILQLRTEVFVVEQRCAYQEVDGQDLTGDTLHLMGWQDDKLVAYLRLLDPQSQGGDVVIGRVVTAPAARELKLGHTLLLKGLEAAEHCWPGVAGFICRRRRICRRSMPGMDSLWWARNILRTTFRISGCARDEIAGLQSSPQWIRDTPALREPAAGAG
ncbi:acetyltransferase [Pseudomonas putida S11]|nr:acetyltransferase [Pseudomonas putida S11]